MEALDLALAERGQIVIPKEARDALGLKPGARLQLRIEGGRLVIEKKVQLDLSRWVGAAVDDGLSTDEALAELRGRPVPTVVCACALWWWPSWAATSPPSKTCATFWPHARSTTTRSAWRQPWKPPAPYAATPVTKAHANAQLPISLSVPTLSARPMRC